MKTNEVKGYELTFGDVENIINRELKVDLPRIEKFGEENPSNGHCGLNFLKIKRGNPIRKYFTILPFEKTCKEAYPSNSGCNNSARFLDGLPADFSGYKIIGDNLGVIGIDKLIYGVPNKELARLSRIYASVTYDEENSVKFFDSKGNPINGNPIKSGWESEFKEEILGIIFPEALGNCSDLIYDSKGIDNIFKEMVQKNGYLISAPMSFPYGTGPVRPKNNPFVYETFFNYKGSKGVINLVTNSDLLDKILTNEEPIHREDASGLCSD